MKLKEIKMYGALQEQLKRTGHADEKKIRKIEDVFTHIYNREVRSIFALWCYGYTYRQIQQHYEAHGCPYSYNTIKSKVYRTIKQLEKEGVIDNE